MRRILVRASVLIVVEYPDDETNDHIQFQIEENSCPGTGRVGAALSKQMEEDEKESVCWACNLQGENKIEKWDI